MRINLQSISNLTLRYYPVELDVTINTSLSDLPTNWNCETLRLIFEGHAYLGDIFEEVRKCHTSIPRWEKIIIQDLDFYENNGDPSIFTITDFPYFFRGVNLEFVRCKFVEYQVDFLRKYKGHSFCDLEFLESEVLTYSGWLELP